MAEKRKQNQESSNCIETTLLRAAQTFSTQLFAFAQFFARHNLRDLSASGRSEKQAGKYCRETKGASLSGETGKNVRHEVVQGEMWRETKPNKTQPPKHGDNLDFDDFKRLSEAALPLRRVSPAFSSVLGK